MGIKKRKWLVCFGGRFIIMGIGTAAEYSSFPWQVINMAWLMAIVIIVMAAGLVATLIIGQSKSNKEADPRYSQNTGKKWLRLGGIYVVGMIIVAAIVIALNN